MNDFSVDIYQPKFREVWNAFVANSKNGTFLFHRDFMEYHQERFLDFSLMVFRNGKVVGLLPANIVENDLHSHQGLTYGGLILSKTIRFETVLKIYRRLLEFLSTQGIEALYIKEIPSIYCKMPSDEIRYFNFILEAELIRRDTLSVIDTHSQFKFSSGRLEGVKRGQKHQLEVVNDDGFEAFWKNILEVNLKEKHAVAPVHSLSDILFLKQKFPKAIKQFNVYHNKILVAGATIFETDQVAHCQYISGNEAKNSLGSLDFLHAHLIQSVYQNKRYFDFGTSNENRGLQVNGGLQFWKEGFGARTITQDFYKIVPRNYNMLDTVLK